ncbi:MAG: hypothetical protein GY774_22320 [Planctomycetes bacterium]|nr:hypothetical protein [Planctomycetota bacterium]
MSNFNPQEKSRRSLLVLAEKNTQHLALKQVVKDGGLNIIIAGDTIPAEERNDIVTALEAMPIIENLIIVPDQEAADNALGESDITLRQMQVVLSMGGGPQGFSDIVLHTAECECDYDALMHQINKERGCENMKKPAFLLEQRKFKGKKARRQHH